MNMLMKKNVWRYLQSKDVRLFNNVQRSNNNKKWFWGNTKADGIRIINISKNRDLSHWEKSGQYHNIPFSKRERTRYACIRTYVCTHLSVCICMYMFMCVHLHEQNYVPVFVGMGDRLLIFLATLLGSTEGKNRSNYCFPICNKKVNLFFEIYFLTHAIFHLFQYFLHRNVAKHLRKALTKFETGSVFRDILVLF